jgi:hypothetical protein
MISANKLWASAIQIVLLWMVNNINLTPFLKHYLVRMVRKHKFIFILTTQIPIRKQLMKRLLLFSSTRPRSLTGPLVV